LTEPDFLPASGEHIGPHRIVRALGRGGMGEVFLARDDRLNRWVAIKRIRHDGDTLNLRQRLLHEAHAVGGLHHSAIVLVYDLLEHEGDDCIVMEYVQGQTLAEALRGGPLNPALAVRLAAKVASGLAAAHEAGFLHRDLKAENVMVTPAKEVKILDFGLAKPIGLTADASSLTATGFVVGTRRSMSPEQARGGEVDERSDLYSLGILLYEMLTGSSPFQGSHSPATLTKLLRSSLPPRLVVLLERLLAQNPAARPQSASEVTRELEAIAASLGPPGDFSSEETLSDLPTDAIRRWGGDTTPPLFPPVPAPTSPPERPRQPGHRRRLMIAVLSSLVVLFAAAIGLRHYWPARTKLLWVVVANPQGTGQDPQLQRAAAALVKANLKALGLLKGVVPVGPIVGPQEDDWTEAAAAEDLLTTTLKPASNHQWMITLGRRRGSDGKVLDELAFKASLDAQSLQGLDQLVGRPLRTLFPSNPPRDDVRKEDYAAFFEIEQRIAEGQEPLKSDLIELNNLVGSPPHFLEAQLLEADVLVKTHRERERLIDQARKLAPNDPRPLQSEFRLQLADRHWDQAARTLSDLSALESGNPKIPELRADLEDERSPLVDTYNDREKAARYVRSWRNLLSLAKVEEKLGMADAALDTLTAILRDSPSNVYASRRLAELDLYYKNPADAERIYETLPASSRTFGDYVNLGTARVLLHRYKDAIEDFNQALEIKPEEASAKLNLADAELALGQEKPADALYQAVLQQLEVDHGSGGNTTADAMIKAQCLAHLRQPRKATNIVEDAVKRNNDNTDIIVSAAQVFTLARDNVHAMEKIQSALDHHVGPNWFKLPVFSPLFNDPQFQQVMDEALRDQASESPAEKHAR
jgi:tetratricopeptide (TPR) repeat protein/predicted Ser/Thr protein kinase